jgi:uncharacterized iron-regulated membrane protein
MIVTGLLAACSCRLELDSLPDVIQGIWNITRVNITGDGLSNPDVENYSVQFEPSIDPETYSATLIHFLPSKRQEDQHRLRLAINSTTETFSLDIESFTLNSAFTVSMRGTRHFYGALLEPDVTFSFVCFTQNNAELTLFYRSEDQMIVYRCTKMYKRNVRQSLLGAILSIGQRMIFRIV